MLKKMKLNLWRSALTLVLCSFATVVCADKTSPVGTWRTIDDVTGKPRSIIEIKQDEKGVLSGYIREVIAIPGLETHDTCVKCKGDLKDKPIIGMRILWDMVPAEGEWKGGQILDPKKGRTYSCRLWLDNDGKELEVRGFIGFSLIGRTQTWHRVTN